MSPVGNLQCRSNARSPKRFLSKDRSGIDPCIFQHLECRTLLNGITLDPTFGSGGVVLTDFSNDTDFGYAMSPLPNGKVLMAGQSWNGSGYDFSLARYNSDGSLDSSFGNGGRVLTNVGSNADAAFAMAVAPDGKIVL